MKFFNQHSKQENIASQYWGYRELTQEELAFVGGGYDEDGDDVPTQDTPLPTITVTANVEQGASYGEGLTMGAAAGGTAGLLSSVAGGAAMVGAGDAIAIGGALGGAVGVAAVAIGASIVAVYDHFESSTQTSGSQQKK
ncbi:hypothetical protein J8I26_07225 [Herbaspirillum sp. LeCh32-8]|uniref:hypothetical protein n=1 Tax=Herbaspirillum sp. LeCh32-8 TaxID=2821356 RepID=UPI001AE25EB8|nr:hypothetical protein [Herbaspirillum sp. LeCh32-8]MBP0597885.1 hypothetical protein [Herbaspirillum sp. LeCh32-8]